MPTLERYEDVIRFRDEVYPFLLEDEALNCVLLGALSTIKPQSPKRRYFAVVKDGGRIVGVAWMTPPFPFGLTRMPPAAFPLLLEDAAAFGEAVTGVVGPSECADPFVEAWRERTGAAVRSVMRQRFFLADRIAAPPPVPGGLRLATPDDLPLVTDWNRAFAADCGLAHEVPDPRAFAEEAIREGSRWLWEVDGGPVAMTGVTGRTPNGIRINWVYTPPARRRRGYAGALVATLSQKLLDEGRRYCFLATDLANPTSNRLYQSLGYRPAGDASYWIFRSPLPS